MENNEITLDKIELVKDRTGVSYREAKEALEKNDGNVVDAIISIEDSINISVKKDSKVNELVAKIKETVKKGNIAKIVISKNEQTVLNLPVNAGLIGTVLFPWAMVAGVIAAFGTKCSIELFREDGEVINLSEKAGSVVDTVVSKGGVVFDEVKDKSSDLFDAAVEKGTQVFNTVKDKSSDIVDAAVDKGENFVEMAKTKASEIRNRAPQKEEMQSDDFDLSDIELDEMQPAEEENLGDIEIAELQPEEEPAKSEE